MDIRMNLDLISTNYFDIALYGGVNILVSILLYLFFAWMKNRIVARIKGKGNLFQIVNIILSRFHNIGVFLLLFVSLLPSKSIAAPCKGSAPTPTSAFNVVLTSNNERQMPDVHRWIDFLFMIRPRAIVRSRSLPRTSHSARKIPQLKSRL